VSVSARGARSIGTWGAVSTGLLLAAAAIVLVTLLAAVGSERLSYDFRESYLPAAEAVRDGESPYPAPESPLVEAQRAYVYPPQLALALVPLTALPVDVAAVVGFLVCLTALMGALAVLGVRDVRCYAAVLVWAPAFNALEMANASAVVALGAALAWRLRSTLWPFAVVLGLTVTAKLYTWPLVVWAATRRLLAACLALGIGLVVTALSWAVVGFDGLRDYPALVERLTEAHAERSYSLVGVASALGLDPDVGRVLLFVLGGALLVACVILGRAGDERRSFTCAVGAALVLTPILWQHHLVVLVAPLALARPRFSLVWLLPAALWLSPRGGNGDGLEALLPLLVVGALLWALLARPRVAAAVVEAT
jgi:hypothetical protein